MGLYECVVAAQVESEGVREETGDVAACSVSRCCRLAGACCPYSSEALLIELDLQVITIFT